MTSKDANLKAANEAFTVQSKLAMGVVDPAMMAEFGAKFAGFYAPKFDLSMGPGKAEFKQGDFPTMMKTVHPIFEGLRNKDIKFECEAINDTQVKVVSVFDSVYTDAHGDDVPDTAKKIEFTTIATYDDNAKMTSFVQTWDVAEMDRCRKLEAEANAKIFERNKGLYGELMGLWGSGSFNSTNPDAFKLAEEKWSADFVADARYPSTYADGFKLYEGTKAGVEWCHYLEKNWDMPDFAVAGIFPGPKGEVWAQGSSTPVHKPSGKSLPFKVEWFQRVGFNKEGKCTYFKFFNGPTAVYQDSLAAPNEAVVPPMIPTPPKPEADADFGKNMEIWGGMMAAWGSGKFGGDKATALKELSKFFAEDVIADARYPAKTFTEIDAVFKGVEGIYQWCAVLAGWDMPDFQMKHVTEGAAPGEIVCMMNSTPIVKATGKTIANYHTIARFIVSKGKISHCQFHWGPEAWKLGEAHVPDAAKMFIVEHTFKAGKADEWWKNMTEMMGKPVEYNAWVTKQREMGFVGHQFMPEGGDKPVQCMWECRDTITKAEFQKFIDSPMGPGDTCLVNTVYPVMPGAQLPGTNFFVDPAGAPANVAQTKGSFFWIHHEFKNPDAAKKFWEMMGGMDEAAMRGMTINNTKLGFHNHTFAPTAMEGPVFCCWESEKDITVEEFQTFIDGPDGPGAGAIFNNTCHKVPAGMGQVPSAKFAAPFAGAMLPIKSSPTTAAVTANVGMAA